MDKHGLCCNSRQQVKKLNGSRGVISNIIRSQTHIHLRLLQKYNKTILATQLKIFYENVMITVCDNTLNIPTKVGFKPYLYVLYNKTSTAAKEK